MVLVGPAPPLRGGVAQHSAGLAGALRRAGIRCSILSYRALYPAAFFPGRSQVHEDPAWAAVQSVRELTGWNPVPNRRARTMLRSADLLLLQYWHPAFVPLLIGCALTARSVGCRVALICHNVEPHERVPGAALLLRGLLKVVDEVLCHSRFVADRCVQLRGSRGDGGALVSPMPALLPSDFRLSSRGEARARLGLDADAPLLVCAGLRREYKGVSGLLDAWRGARPPATSRLALVGEVYGSPVPVGGQVDSLIIEVDQYLDIEEFMLWIASADVGILPYLAGSQSGVLPLFRLAEVPVLVSAVGGLAEAAASGERGIRQHEIYQPGTGTTGESPAPPESFDPGVLALPSGDSGAWARAISDSLSPGGSAGRRIPRPGFPGPVSGDRRPVPAGEGGPGESGQTPVQATWKPLVEQIARLLRTRV